MDAFLELLTFATPRTPNLCHSYSTQLRFQPKSSVLCTAFDSPFQLNSMFRKHTGYAHACRITKLINAQQLHSLPPTLNSYRSHAPAFRIKKWYRKCHVNALDPPPPATALNACRYHACLLATYQKLIMPYFELPSHPPAA